MKSTNPSTTGGKRPEVEPLVVKPHRAMVLLDCSRTYVYELIGRGELESYTDGAARKITLQSIHAYIARKLAAAQQQAA